MSLRNTGRTILGEILWTPWSLFCWVLSAAWLTFVLLSILPFCLFRPFEKWQTIWGHALVGCVVRFTFSRLVVEIDPRYDRSRTNVLAQNHVSMLDACIACGAIPVPFCGLENAAHLMVPGYGWLLRMANAIPVRKGTRRYEELAAAVAERASRGISILAFPEAHRTLDGNVQPFKRGVFRMARDAGIPIVPVCTRGAFRLLPKGSFTSRPSVVEVYIGPQVETKGLSNRHLEILAARMRETMQAWVDRREKRADLYLAPIDDGDEAENVA